MRARAHSHTHINTHTRTHKHSHTYAYTRTHTHARARAHTHTHTHTHTHSAGMHTHTHTHAYKHTHTHTHTYARARAYTHTRAPAHADTHTRAPAHAHTHARTHVHARAHTHTHTHTHTLQFLVDFNSRHPQKELEGGRGWSGSRDAELERSCLYFCPSPTKASPAVTATMCRSSQAAVSLSIDLLDWIACAPCACACVCVCVCVCVWHPHAENPTIQTQDSWFRTFSCFGPHTLICQGPPHHFDIFGWITSPVITDVTARWADDPSAKKHPCTPLTRQSLPLALFPNGRPGMSDVPLLSGLSGLSFDPLSCLLPCLPAWSSSCLVLFLLLEVHSPDLFSSENSPAFFVKWQAFCIGLVEQLGDDSW